ncbi:hypothetical protein AaE_010312 [Aphanomyces astaci]|uniref:RING-type domain-containing protein n=1 Tax=Aphanomyces astaci TaxID=112090 RepID=A0A6A4ZPM5_APHAT|nr:hypothetical protein AaE_010312 [Aphanomyces astaci]
MRRRVVLCACGMIGIAPTIAVSSPWTHASARLVQQPMAREGTVLEVIGDAAYIYGGAGDSSDAVFNDAWKFDFLGQRWLQVATAGEANPGARFDHVSTAHGTDMYIFGGTSFDPKAIAANNDGTTQTNDVWKLDTMQSMWTVVDGGGHGGSFRPAARSQATAVSAPQAMVVFGGVVIPNVFYLSPVDLNDVWKFEYQSHSWHSVVIASNSSVPTTRFSHAATTIQLNGDLYMVVFSGRHIFDTRWTILNDAWMLPLTSGSLPSWTRLTANHPFNRILSGVVATDSGYLWFFGGFAFDTTTQREGVAFADALAAEGSLLPWVNMVEDSSPVQNEYAGPLNYDDMDGPSARFGHRMSVWNGNVVVYGGRFVQCLGDVWLRNGSVSPRGASPSTATGPRSMHLTMPLNPPRGDQKHSTTTGAAIVWSWMQRPHHTAAAGRVQGLSADDIAQFKVVPFTPSATIDPTDEICPICLVEFVAEEGLRQLPCQHHFHPNCIGEWLQRNLTCPMCKRDLSPIHAAAASTTSHAPTNGVVIPLFGSIIRGAE